MFTTRLCRPIPPLVFKGGTAIHHHYLPQLRFSEDLDFTAIDQNISLDEVKAVFEAYDFFVTKKEYSSRATIKLEKLQYAGILAQPNHIKVEIDHLQGVVLPAKRLAYKNAWNLDVHANVMDIREVCAEKIRAMSDRSRYRDFYDFYLIWRDLKPDLDEVIELVRQKEIRKPITKNKIFANWQNAQAFKAKDLSTIFLKEQIDERHVLTVLEKLPFSAIH